MCVRKGRENRNCSIINHRQLQALRNIFLLPHSSHSYERIWWAEHWAAAGPSLHMIVLKPACGGLDHIIVFAQMYQEYGRWLWKEICAVVQIHKNSFQQSCSIMSKTSHKRGMMEIVTSPTASAPPLNWKFHSNPSSCTCYKCPQRPSDVFRKPNNIQFLITFNNWKWH